MSTRKLWRVCASSPSVELGHAQLIGVEPTIIELGRDGVSSIRHRRRAGVVEVRFESKPPLVIPLQHVWYMVAASRREPSDGQV
jgi:hypothetical protein